MGTKPDCSFSTSCSSSCLGTCGGPLAGDAQAETRPLDSGQGFTQQGMDTDIRRVFSVRSSIKLFLSTHSNTPDTRRVGFSTPTDSPLLCRHRLCVLRFSSVLALTTQSYLGPQGQGHSHQTPHLRCQSQVPGCPCASGPPAVNPGFPRPPPQL